MTGIVWRSRSNLELSNDIMIKFLFASVLGLAAAAPAWAQDASTPAPQDQSATTGAATSTGTGTDTSAGTGTGTGTGSSLRGFRVEGNAGGDRFRSQGASHDRFGYGATFGFDGQIGDRFVIGPEASWWRANDWTENCTGGVRGGSVCHKSFDEFGVGVRAGVLVAPQFMVFGKGGYVTNEQRKRFDAPAGQTSYYNHVNTDGYQVGGGAELSMANRFQGPLSGLYLNAQYVYSQYADHTSRQRVMGGIGIRFR